MLPDRIGRYWNSEQGSQIAIRTRPRLMVVAKESSKPAGEFGKRYEIWNWEYRITNSDGEAVPRVSLGPGTSLKFSSASL